MDKYTKDETIHMYYRLYKAFRQVSDECLFSMDFNMHEFLCAPGVPRDLISKVKIDGIMDTIENCDDEGERQDRIVFQTFIRQIHETGKAASLEFQCSTDGNRKGRWYRIEANPQLEENGTVSIIDGHIIDIDDIVRERLQMEQLIQTDSLTGLYNLAAIAGKIDEFLQMSLHLTVILLDIDKFEEINERQGQLFRDYIVQQAGRLLRSGVQDKGYVGRVEGSRFILLLQLAKRSEILDVLEKIRSCCDDFSMGHGLSEKISFSAGIARFPWCGMNREAILCNAETALTKARTHGTNSAMFYFEVDSSAEPAANSTAGAEDRSGEDEDLYDTVREILKSGTDQDKILQNILELIAGKLKLDKVSIMELDIQGESVYCMYQWNAEGIPSQKKEYLSYSKNIIRRFLGEIEVSKGQFFIDDVEEEDMGNIFYFSLKHKGLKSAVHYYILENGFVQYSFQFETYRHKHIWSNAEKELLFRISRLISEVLYNQKPGTKMGEFMDRFVNYDRLTTLFTFKRFLQAAQLLHMSYTQERFVVSYTDFRNFKYINDAFGYTAGDKILCEFAGMLKNQYGSELNCTGRVNNDCFVTMSIWDGEEAINEGIDELKKRFSQYAKTMYPGINLIMDTGVYALKAADEIANALDNANYARKTIKTTVLNGGTLIFDDKLHKQLAWQSQVLNSLDTALVRDEFIVYYQPKVSLKDSRIVGAEALIRWQREEGDISYPDQFIPFCEEHDVIDRLDFFVLEKTCRMLHDWIEDGKQPICVSVNLSRNDCMKAGFAERIIQCVDDWSIPHDYIEFEITESAFTDDLAALDSFLNKLRAVGFDISMDDFGSGYSSLNILPDMPVSIIKLDKEFWRKDSNTKRKVLLIKVVEILKMMGFRVLSEGIEKKEQAEFCRQIGCDMAQGYLFSKPVPRENFEALLCQQII